MLHACHVKLELTTMQKVWAQHATDVQTLRLQVQQVAMRVFQASTNHLHHHCVAIVHRENLLTILTLPVVRNVQLDIMPKTLLTLLMSNESVTTVVLDVLVASTEPVKNRSTKPQDVASAMQVDFQN